MVWKIHTNTFFWETTFLYFKVYNQIVYGFILWVFMKWWCQLEMQKWPHHGTWVNIGSCFPQAIGYFEKSNDAWIILFSAHSRERPFNFIWFFSKKNILIPNVAEKNILILVEEKKIIIWKKKFWTKQKTITPPAS
jgi:hypothetical protein